MVDQVNSISIVVAFYNNSEYLSRVIRSIEVAVSGSLFDYELIIVDDCSSQELHIDSCEVEHRIIRLNTRAGVSRTRNAGAKASKYPWILFIDSDVSIAPDSLKFCEGHIVDGNLDGLCGIYKPKIEGVNFLATVLSTYASFNWESIRPNEQIHTNPIMWSQFFLIRKSSLDAVGGFDVSIERPCLDDTELSIRLSQLGARLLVDKRIKNLHLKNYSVRMFLVNYFIKALAWVDLSRKYPNFIYEGYETAKRKLSFLGSIGMVATAIASCFVGTLVPGSLLISLFVVALTLFSYANTDYIKYVIPRCSLLFVFTSLPVILLINVLTLIGICVGVLRLTKRIINNIAKCLRMGKNYLFKPHGHIESLTLFVTNKCNMSCYYCCYGEHLNKNEDILTLSELEAISKTITVENIIVTGGEPFIRRDLANVISNFYQNSKTRKISIISNGSAVDRIKPIIFSILQLCPQLHVILNLSNEGNEKVHDEIRGKGAYAKLETAFNQLTTISNVYPQLKVSYIFTFNSTNQNTLLNDIKQEAHKNLNTIPTVNLQRGDYRNKFVDNLDIEQYRSISDFLFSQNKLRNFNFFLSSIIVRAKRQTQLLNYTTYRDRRFKSTCFAGRLNATLYNTGALAPCEMLKDSFGNVRDFDYDLKRMLKQNSTRAITKRIVEENCFCTHECNQITNILFNPRHIPKLLFGRSNVAS